MTLPLVAFVLACAMLAAAASSDFSLQYAQIITRHGARTTIHPMPIEQDDWVCVLTPQEAPDASLDLAPSSRFLRLQYDAGWNQLPGNCMLGQLTDKGLAMHEELGSRWRDAYIATGFLPTTFDASLIELRSTDVQRTKQSLWGQLATMYPHAAEEEPAVVVVHTSDNNSDDMIPHPDSCSRLSQRVKELNHEAVAVDYFLSLEPERERACAAYGFDAATDGCNGLTWVPMWDNWSLRLEQDMGLPSGIDTELYDLACDAANFTVWEQYSDLETTRLSIGAFLKQLLLLLRDAADRAAAASPGPRFRLFSGHDSTIAPLMGAFRDWDYVWPPLASSIQMELYFASGTIDPYVQVIFNGRPLSVPGCGGTMCPLARLEASLAPFTLADRNEYAAACQPL
jgi:acid phosphatase